MKKIKQLLVRFENDLAPNLVAAFRGAIIEKVGREHILFHHHNGDKELLYKYPLIQYKSINRKAGILCLGDGCNEMYRLFNQENQKIKLHDQIIDLKIDNLEMGNFNLNEQAHTTRYLLVNWLGLNPDNLKKFNLLQGVVEKVSFLENIIKANILSVAKGIEWSIEKEIKVSIIEVKDERIIRLKGNPLKAFDLIFETNVTLPYYIGLGKSVSHGYGMIKPINTKKI